MNKEFVVLAVHGEGDRDTINALQAHRNTQGHPAVSDPPDEPADVVVILRDAVHSFRIEWPVTDWNEIEEWKKLIGWDAEKRHWKVGGKVTVSIG